MSHLLVHTHISLLLYVCSTFLVSAENLSFSRHIAPILSDNCYKCHGPDAENNRSEFRLDTFTNATADLGGYAGIVPHNIEASKVIETILSTDPDIKMPPPESHLKLTKEEVILLKKWISQGAKYENHWAFTSLPNAISVPRSKHASPKNEIDHFISKRLDHSSFTPSSETTKERWLRRVSFDLIGLPPNLSEIIQFKNDTTDLAYENVIDRLLSSPAYGERMATEWLDVARYSDSYGYQVDRQRTVWQWRDWVLNSFNNNLRYNEFITHQLAGDLIPNSTQQTKLATTFNRLHGQKGEGGSIPEEFRQAYISDRTNTAATAFLGLTMDCTRCHDHKYDPLTQKDYFSLAAFFSNIDEFGLYSFMNSSVPTPSLALSSPEQEKNLFIHQNHIDTLEEELLAVTQAVTDSPLLPLISQEFSKEANGGKLLNGDAGIKLGFKATQMARETPITFTVTAKLPIAYEDAFVMGTAQAALDSGYRGLSVIIEEGKVVARLAHFYPGDCIDVITDNLIPLNEWLQLSVTYDGSSRASGLRIFLNGDEMRTQIRHDQLTNTILTNDKDTIVTIGAVLRNKGLKDTLIKSVSIYKEALTESQLMDLNTSKTIFQSNDVFKNKLAALQAARKTKFNIENSIPRIMTMRERENTPIKTYLLNRGNYNEPTDEVQPAIPEVLPDLGLIEKSKSRRLNRLDLAEWMTHPDNPLTARVTVNRYWQMFFRDGLVKTSEDFGLQTSGTSYPYLLDWLAKDFINSGWDLHHLIKKITLSHTYRQSSIMSPELLDKDPDNELLSTFPATPLTAEMLRDSALAHSKLLSDRIGVGTTTPYDLAESFKPVSSASQKGLHQYRRSLYTLWRVTGPSPLMTTLDSAKRDVCSVKREKTATPLRSLVLLNSPQFIEAARTTAVNLLSDKSVQNKVSTAFKMLTSRDPREEEKVILESLFHQQFEYFSQHPDEAAELLSVGHKEVPEKLSKSEVAALSNTILTLLNHDEAQMKY